MSQNPVILSETEQREVKSKDLRPAKRSFDFAASGSAQDDFQACRVTKNDLFSEIVPFAVLFCSSVCKPGSVGSPKRA